jgi:hypothetical protein
VHRFDSKIDGVRDFEQSLRFSVAAFNDLFEDVQEVLAEQPITQDAAVGAVRALQYRDIPDALTLFRAPRVVRPAQPDFRCVQGNGAELRQGCGVANFDVSKDRGDQGTYVATLLPRTRGCGAKLGSGTG